MANTTVEVTNKLHYDNDEDPRDLAEHAQQAAFRSIRQGSYDLDFEDPSDWEVVVYLPGKKDEAA